MHLKLSKLESPTPGELELEIVERKGLGHPDTICDALAEELSRALCRVYMDEFGFVLHHNVDKGLLFAGRSLPAFGGGRVLEPIEIYQVGRATIEFNDKKIDVKDIAARCVRNWFEEHFTAIEPDKHLYIQTRLRPGSPDLVELFARQAEMGVPLANDTSCGVGFAPLTVLERVVLEVERHLNSSHIRGKYPAFGPDVKVMGVRNGDKIELTIACAFIDKFVADLGGYRDLKFALAQTVLDKAREFTELPIDVQVNCADDLSRGSIYLTVTGTSSESGDDGEVGRGNRANGLITPFRPMVMEAAAGKNPVTHVGKIYNIAAMEIAEESVKVAGVKEAYCYLVSRIGQPVTEPACGCLDLRLERGATLSDVETKVKDIYYSKLQGLNDFTKIILRI